MLIALPLLTFAAIYLHVWDSRRIDSEAVSDWRGSFLIASLLWGTLVVVITEGLSLFEAIGRLEIASSWAVMLLLLIAFGIRRRIFRAALAKIQIRRNWFSTFEWFIIIGIMFIVLSLAIVAWIAPPNNTDSLAYHLPRIVHWIQNRNLRHYPTAYHPQLLTSPFSEMAILQFWLLWGSNRPANMIQWFSMLGSLVAVTAIAKRLGANRSGQLLTASFTISVPIGILQSTSTQTDYVATFWLLCLAYFVVVSKRRELNRLEMLSIMLATGLGILTKGTFYPFSVPFLLWFYFSRLRRHGLRRTAFEGMALLGVMLILNAGFFVRNIDTYGGPLGSSDWLEYKTEVRLTLQSWISATAKQGALNFASPRVEINESIIAYINALDNKLGISGDEFNLIWAWNHEDLAGNPLHLIVLLISIPVLFIICRKAHQGLPLQYGVAFLGSIFLHVVIVMFDLYGVRHQLTLFILGTPILGVLFSNPTLKRYSGVATTFFLLISLPWILFNSTRPIIALRPSPEPWSLPYKFSWTRTGSIFFRTREDLLFANWPGVKEPAGKISEIIRAEGCTDVGLRIDSHDLEYLYQWSLGAPQSNVRVKTIYTYPILERYLDAQFKPCAIICTICGEQREIHGLRQVYSFEDHSLYMGPGFTWEKDN